MREVTKGPLVMNDEDTEDGLRHSVGEERNDGDEKEYNEDSRRFRGRKGPRNSQARVEPNVQA